MDQAGMINHVWLNC